jgi:hypothetical protein
MCEGWQYWERYMPPKSKIHSSRDSFMDVLRSEITAENENLAAWIKQVALQGAIESLFALETWLKGIRAFFKIEHLSLGASERSELVTRSFGPEIGVVKQAVQVCENFACNVMKTGISGKFEFEEFMEVQMRKDRIADAHINRMVEQLTPKDSVSRLLGSLNDFRVTIDAFKEPSALDYQLFLSLGRAFARELGNCRYIDMLINQGLRLQYDLIEDKSLAGVLRIIPEEAVRRNTAIALLYLFRFLRYLKLISTDLDQDRPLKKHLVIFSLLHEEMGALSDFLRARFLRDKEAEHPVRSAAELITYSLKIESQRVLDRELVFVSCEKDPGIVYTRIENSHGLLHNCCQSGILALVQAIDKDFDAAALFPDRAENLPISKKLRQDLLSLRQWLIDVLGNKEALDSAQIVARLASFKESSLRSLMYRDWAEFEAFSDALAISTNFIEMRTHIRKFVSFLEMLTQEVSKRSVFQGN